MHFLKERFRAFKSRLNGGIMRFKEKHAFENRSKIITFMLYFSKKHEKQNRSGKKPVS